MCSGRGSALQVSLDGDRTEFGPLVRHEALQIGPAVTEPTPSAPAGCPWAGLATGHPAQPPLPARLPSVGHYYSSAGSHPTGCVVFLQHSASVASPQRAPWATHLSIGKPGPGRTGSSARAPPSTLGPTNPPVRAPNVAAGPEGIAQLAGLGHQVGRHGLPTCGPKPLSLLTAQYGQ